jgi:hypothetical protein
LAGEACFFGAESVFLGQMAVLPHQLTPQEMARVEIRENTVAVPGMLTSPQYYTRIVLRTYPREKVY